MKWMKKFYLSEQEEIRLSRVFLSILFVWLISGLALFFYPKRGEFGDMFGSINTLFSGLAFGGIIYTIFQQKIELKLQREEIKLQRYEVEKTNQELANQVEAMNAQRFDSTFYNLISVHHQLVSGLSEKDSNGNPTITGRNVFDRIYKKMYQINSDQITKKLIDTFKDRKFLLAHYFNHLAGIVSFIKLSTALDEKMKDDYISTLRAQISPAESMVIFYYILYIGPDTLQSIYLTEIIILDAIYVPHELLPVWSQVIKDFHNLTQ